MLQLIHRVGVNNDRAHGLGMRRRLEMCGRMTWEEGDLQNQIKGTATAKLYGIKSNAAGATGILRGKQAETQLQ